jgi:hypothetical protein
MAHTYAFVQQLCLIGEQWETVGVEEGTTDFFPTRAEAQADLDDMFAGMKEQGMDFRKGDWRIRRVKQ